MFKIGDYVVNAKVYIPVDNASQRIRHAMNKEHALNLIREMKNVEILSVENEREREKVYKDILKKCDPKSMVSVIKTLYLRRQDRLLEGKKTIVVEEHYFKLAENHLHSELAFALQISKEEIIQVIMQNIE